MSFKHILFAPPDGRESLVPVMNQNKYKLNLAGLILGFINKLSYKLTLDHMFVRNRRSDRYCELYIRFEFNRSF